MAAATPGQESSVLTWIIERIKRHLYWRNWSVTHQTSNASNNMPENQGNFYFLNMFDRFILCISE